MALISPWVTALAMSLVLESESTVQEVSRDRLHQLPTLQLEGGRQLPFAVGELLECEDSVLDGHRWQADRQILEVRPGDQGHVTPPRERSQGVLELGLVDGPCQEV